MWVRGLKLVAKWKVTVAANVAPYVGAWIETDASNPGRDVSLVAPYVGAWIETSRNMD